jgi:ParB family chromosome partitioning protein
MLVDIDKIQVKDRIRKDFGNIQELADDIKENGLINPPVITPDTYELIAGERRLRAMKKLGFKQVEVRPMAVKDAEHALNLEISENETRKDFSKAERIDYAKRLERIEELKAKERMEKGDNQYTQDSPSLNSDEGGRTDDIVAKKLDIGGRDTYRKEKFIVDNKESLSPTDFAEWDEGKLSTNKAFNQIKEKLQEANEENQRLRNVNAGYEMKLQKVHELENQISDLKQELDNRPTVEKTVEVKPNDYDSIKKSISGYKQDYTNLESQYNKKIKELTDLKAQVKSMTELSPEEQYSKKLKDDAIMYCAKIDNFISQVGGLSYLSDHIKELPDNEKRAYIKATELVEAWAYNIKMNMKQYLNDKN